MKERLMVWVYYGNHQCLLLFQRGGSKNMGNEFLTGMWPQPYTMPYPKGGCYEIINLKKSWFYLLVVLKVYKWNQNIFGSCDTRIYPFSNPENLVETKTTHPQSPRPRSRTGYTFVSYDPDRQTWPRPYLWHPSGPSPCWKRNDQTADLHNAGQCSPGRQTCWLCQWLAHRVHLDRVPQGPSGPRERSAKLHLKNAMFGHFLMGVH